MKLSLFDGGLNTRAAANLIQPNESVVCSNVDSSSGILSSAKGLTVVPNLSLTEDSFWNPLTEEWMTKSHDTDPSTWRNHVVLTGDDGPSKLVNGAWKPLGLAKPEDAPNASPVPRDAPTMDLVLIKILEDFTNASSEGGTLPNDQTMRVRVVVRQGATIIKVLTKSYSIAAPNNQLNITVSFNPADAAFPYGAPALLNPLVYEVYFEPPFPADWRLVKQETLANGTEDLSVSISSVTQGTPATAPSGQNVGDNLQNQAVEYWVSYERSGFRPKPTTIVRTTPVGQYVTALRLYQFLSTPNKMFAGIMIGGVPYKLLEVDNHNSNTYYTILDNTLPGVAMVLGGLEGTYNYVYTWYDETDGTESAPSPVSDEAIAQDQDVQVTVPELNKPAEASLVRLYRIGGQWSEFKLVTEFAPTGASVVYTDQASDASLLSAEVLTADTNYVPPVLLRQLTKSQGVFWGAVEDTLWLGDANGNPNYWSPVSVIDFPATITALADSIDGLLVFTSSETYLVRGNTTELASLTKISGSQGCVSLKSVATGNREIWFVSREGICQYQSGGVNVTSRPQLGTLDLAVTKGVFFNDVYYVQLEDKSTLVLDLKYLPKFYHASWNVCTLLKKPGTLYALDLSGEACIVYTPETSDTLLEYTYKTGVLTEGMPTMLKNYDNFYVRATGQHTIEIYIDGNLAITHVLDGTKMVYDIAVPQAHRRGYELQLAMTGVGQIYEIEYKVGGREHG